MDLETEASSVCAHMSEHIISVTADLGFCVVRDLRVGRRNIGQYEQKIVVAGVGLVDHCWTKEDQLVLAYADGN